MEFTKNSPIKYDVKVNSGSTIKCEFKIKGTKKPIRLNIALNIYYKHPTHINMFNTVSSDVQSVYTSKSDTTHKIEIKVPEFKNCTQSYINIQMDNSADIYEKAYLKYINVDVGTIQYVEPQQQQQPKQIIEEVSSLRQSLADQLRASTIIPNTIPRTRPSAPMDIFSQCNTIRNRQLENIQIQDIQARHSDTSSSSPPLNIVSTIIGKGNEIIEGHKIVLASIVRNEQKNGNIVRFLDCCEKLEKYHKNIIYIFIEGDSLDGTYSILKNWIEKRDGSILQKIDIGYPPFPKSRDLIRTTYFAQLRNILVDSILSIPDATEILMIDANYEFDNDIISQLREANSDIVAPLVVSHKDSKGKYIFYDIWAFRKNDTEFWPFYPYAEGMVFDNPVDVDSVGGCYLIKRKVLEAGARYDGNSDSEQIGFCNNVRKFGFNIKVNPKISIKKMRHNEL